MKTLRLHRLLPLLGLFALVACDESSTEPLFDDVTPDEALELAVLEDPASLDVSVDLTTTTNDVAASFGHAGAQEARGLNDQARGLFGQAREALRAGDHRGALEIARQARRLIVQAVIATDGQDAVVALIERIEDLAVTDVGDDDVFDDPGAVTDRLQRLADVARDRLDRGDALGAGERALLGEQHARHHRGRRDHRGDIRPERARLAVALAATAVQLAERLIEENDVPLRDVAASDIHDRMNRWLVQAKHMLARAERALGNGHFARAVHFAHHAHWSALKAVILPGGVTEEETQAMAELANQLYGEAEAALGDDPSELELRLFERAGHMIARGEEMLAEGNKRGVVPLWRAAVISRWLIG